MSDFNKDGSIIGQNAGTTAASLMGVFYRNGFDRSLDEFLQEYEVIRKAVFDGSLEFAQVDRFIDAGFDVKQVEQATAPRRNYGSGSGSRGRSSGGQSSGNVREFTLNFGKYRDRTLADIYDEDPDYLTWVAENGNNEFARKKVQEFLSVAA